MATQPETPPAVRIERVDRVPAVSPERFGQEDLLVTYMVKGRQPISLRIDKTDASTADIEKMVREDARKFHDLIGKDLTL